jgi:transcription factor 1
MFRTRPSIPQSQWSWSARPWLQSRCASRVAGRPKNLKVHFTPEKLVTSDRYPLTHELNETMHPSMLQKTKKHKAGPGKVVLGSAAKSTANVHVRSQIVSPDLCGMLYLKRRWGLTQMLTLNFRRCSKVHWTHLRKA